MLEIINIIFCLLIFSIFTIVPINIYNNTISKKNMPLNIMIFNLAINLNVLLILSFLSFKLSLISKSYLLILFLILILNYSKITKIIKINFIFLSFLTMAFLVLGIDLSSKLNLGWDAKWFWFIKSIYYFENYFFSDLTNYEFNKYNPHFGSYLWAFFRKLSFLDFEYTGRLFYIFFYLFSLLTISYYLPKKNTEKVLLFISLILITYNYKFVSGLQEILIFSTLVIISKLTYEYIQKYDVNKLIQIILFSNLLLWIKAEGIAYFLIYYLSLNFLSNIKIEKKIYINFIAILLILFKFFIYNYFNISINEQPYFLGYLLNLDLNFIIYKLKYIFIYLSFYSFKNIIFLCVGLFLVFKIKTFFIDEHFKFIFLLFLFNIIFIFSVYVLRDMEIIYSLKTTIDRIILSSSGFYLLFFSQKFIFILNKIFDSKFKYKLRS